MLETLRGATRDVAILCGPKRRYEDYGVRLVPDVICGAGPIAGLHAGLLDAAADGTERIVWLAADTPLVSSALLVELVAALDDASVAFASTDKGVEPLCAAFEVRRSLEAVTRALIGRRLKLTDAMEGLARRDIAVDPLTVANLNTPEDVSAVRDDRQSPR